MNRNEGFKCCVRNSLHGQRRSLLLSGYTTGEGALGIKQAQKAVQLSSCSAAFCMVPSLLFLLPALNNDNGKYWSVGINIKSIFGLPAIFSDAWSLLFMNPGEFSNY